MSMNISCTWAGQSTDQTTLDITRRVCISVVYDYCVNYMDGRGVCGVAKNPRNVGHLAHRLWS